MANPMLQASDGEIRAGMTVSVDAKDGRLAFTGMAAASAGARPRRGGGAAAGALSRPLSRRAPYQAFEAVLLFSLDSVVDKWGST